MKEKSVFYSIVHEPNPSDFFSTEKLFLSIYVNPEQLFVYSHPENGISLSDRTDIVSQQTHLSAQSLFAHTL